MTPMQRAIVLAKQALGTTSPNPAVGAVVVLDGAIIGEGFTLPPGQRHAEIGALQQAGELARGATLYTTLEPCCNFGRTPPCTRAIIAAGINEVHIAVTDPNPAVAGKGRAELENAGISVFQEESQEESQDAVRLYEAFARHINTGLPFVTAKFAMSLDGKIATRTGDSKWVTGSEARSLVQQLRREADAIMVGVNTVSADDPQLTARDEGGHPLARQPLRVVLDSHCRTPTSAKMLREPGQTLIFTSAEASPARMKALKAAGAELIPSRLGADHRVDPGLVVAELGRRDVVSLLVEGGGMVLGSLFDAGLVDKVYAFIAPVIIGGAEAASPVAGQGVLKMAQASRLQRTNFEPMGDDWLITGYPDRGHQCVYRNS
ncbi:MAG TPA: bifunctional diaminohydroxyphosphoribosylaminopyrimidine deaminase/5-amino-6-(5-phosphoribosylamino)uracil reductase RibD [Dehalococcoidia bacterium]|nr:bifunctional diaminohydroxyphosphoribosylaminopyrimidine deaminase/5-amino-6-(5-phosphoribosylamino)uracil reductase RibD [Dehalococcoidia bacterium]